MPRALALLTCLALTLVLPAAASAQDTLLATFENDTLGSPPTFPDIGFTSGLPSGTQTVIDPGNGSQRFRCLDDATDGGCRLGYQATQPLARALTEYVFRIESGATASGAANDFNQQLILLRPLTNPTPAIISIEWSAFAHELGLRIFAGGMEDPFVISNFQWAFDTDYFVEIETDADTDEYRFSIDGQELAGGPLGGDFMAQDRITFTSAFATLGAFQTDDVRVSPLPEPGGLGAAAAVLGTLGLLGRRRAR